MSDDLLRAIERSLRGAKPSPHAPVIDPLDLLSLSRLKTFARLSRSVHTVREPHALLIEILDRALEVTRADRGMIVIRDEATGAWETKVARPLHESDLEEAERVTRRTIAKALEGEFAVSTVDAEVDGASVTAVACAPLRVRAKVVGAAYVDRQGGEGFSPEDLGFLAAFTELAAVALDNVQWMEHLGRENRILREEIGKIPGVPLLVGDSPAMREIYELITRVAVTDANVLVEGESGTGKELIARAIHQLSNRRDGTFVPVHCAAIPEALIESELFGHRRGAFTGAASDRPGLFEVASGGTLFLDEIHAAPVSVQVKLLRALQEREVRRVGDNVSRKVDVRVVAAGNRPLEEEVRSGTFREDLYFRLAVVTITVPPLRKHKEDILPLALHFLKQHAEKDGGGKPKRLARSAVDALLAHSWPGNVRELQNALQKATVLARGARIEAGDLGLASPRSDGASTSLSEQLRGLEGRLVAEALERSGGNVTKAAQSLGVLRQQMQRLVRRHDLSPAQFKKRHYRESNPT